MLGTDYPHQVCSIARTLEVVGERWTPLILREVFVGRSTFDEIVAGVGITRSVLSRRLDHLVDHGVLRPVRYHQRPDRYRYELTDKGADLAAVLTALTRWGDRWYPHPAGPPRELRHADCGGNVEIHLVCDNCGEHVAGQSIQGRLNPTLANNLTASPAQAACNCER